MKKLQFTLLALLLLMTGTKAFAHDIEVKNADGVTIYYVWSNNKTELAVSFRGSYDSEYNEYSGIVVIPESVTYNGQTYSVTSIGNSAFGGCSSLTSVTIPNSVTSIGSYTFYGTGWYNNQADGLLYLDNWLLGYKGNKPTGDLVINEGTIGIGGYAFGDCSGLTSVTIPNSVTSIGLDAFFNCSGLTSITIPNSVTSIGNSAFWGCSSLTSVTIPNSVTSIGYDAFHGCSGLTSVKIGNSVTSIGGSAFSGCSGLTSLTIPNSVTSIGSQAFYNCSGLTSVTIGNGVTSIGNNAFSGASIQKMIWLTNTPPTGYENANGAINYVLNEQFASLRNTFVYPFLSSMFEVDGIKYVPVSPSEHTCDAIDCVYDQSAAHTLIPSTVSYRGIDMKVLKVQPCTCYRNTFIEKLTCDIEGDIALFTFAGCNLLTELSLGDQIKTIGEYAFENCSSLPSISIPKSITAIGNHVFDGCTNLKQILIADGEQELTLGSKESSSLFSDCPLDSVYIGRNLIYDTTSGRGYSPFYQNTTLRTVIMSENETEISEKEFSGCSNLKCLAFGSQLNTIGKEALTGCSSVTQIVSRAATPPVCGSQALDDINKWSCTLTVPTGSLLAYQAANQWKEFFFMLEDGGSGPVIPEDQKCATPSIIVSGNKMIFECETPGAEFTSYLTSSEEFSGSEVVIENKDRTYTLTVYATAPGYDRSEPATMKFIVKQGDVNADGKVDVSDYIGVANIILYGTIDGK